MVTGRGLLGLAHDPAQLRDRADELLSRPPFAQDEGFLAALWRTLREWAATALDRILGPLASSATAGWIVVALGVAVVLVVAWRASRGLTLDQATPAVRPAGVRGRSAAEWHELAGEHQRRGQHDEAVRARYHALVTGLAERGVVEEVPGRTVGELDRELRVVAPDLAPAVVRAGALFEQVYYGARPARAEQSTQLASLVAEVERRTAGRGARRPRPGGGDEAHEHAAAGMGT